MPDIHPTALIDPLAELADDVQIGPYCIVEGQVRIGAGTRLIAHAYLRGPMTMGKNNLVYPYAVIGMDPQDRTSNPDKDNHGTQIGDDNVLREHVTIHAGIKSRTTQVGDRNYLMANSHVAHDCLVGDDCMFANSSALAGHVECGDKVILGGGAGVQQFVRIGRMSFVSGAEGVTRDLPPFCMVHHSKMISGLNLIGLRRNNYRDHIDSVRRAFHILFRMGLPNPVAVERIRQEFGDDPLCVEIADFVSSSRGGITTYADSKTFRQRRYEADDQGE